MAQLQLRPHSVGDIIDSSFTVYRKRFGPMIGIALMLVFIPFVVGVIGGCTITELQTSWPSCDTAIGWIGQIASQIGMVIAAAAAMPVAAEAYAGTSADWRPSAAAGLRRIIPIVVATVVVTVAVAIGFVLVLVPGIFLAVSFAVFTPVLNDREGRADGEPRTVLAPGHRGTLATVRCGAVHDPHLGHRVRDHRLRSVSRIVGAWRTE